MEITSSATTQTTAGATQAASRDSAGALINSDFQTFLTMLTTQMQNQDPLNPMESTDFAVQLATFSGVEQQVRTNDVLATMSAQLGAMNVADLGAWVGAEVRAAVPAHFDSSPVSLHPTPASGAGRTVLVVYNSAGTVVDSMEIPVSDEEIKWAGVDPHGNPFPPGQYTFSLQSYSQDKLIDEHVLPVFSEVIEARVDDDGVILVLEGGAEVPASDVDAIRSAN